MIALFLMTFTAISMITSKPSFQDAPLHQHVQSKEISVHSIFNGFGAILFGLAGANVFPTIHVDMANPNDYTKAILMSLIGMSIRTPTAYRTKCALADLTARKQV